MTRIVTNDYRYKRPKPKRKPVPLGVPAIVTRTGKRSRVSTRFDTSDEAKTASAAPANDDRKPAITTSISRKRARLRHAAQRSADDDALSRESVEREGDDYKRLKAAMARRLRGE